MERTDLKKLFTALSIIEPDEYRCTSTTLEILNLLKSVTSTIPFHSLDIESTMGGRLLFSKSLYKLLNDGLLITFSEKESEDGMSYLCSATNGEHIIVRTGENCLIALTNVYIYIYSEPALSPIKKN